MQGEASLDLRNVFPETALQLETVAVGMQLEAMQELSWHSSGVESYPSFVVQVMPEMNFVLKPAFVIEGKGAFWVSSTSSSATHNHGLSSYAVDVEFWLDGVFICEATIEAFSIEAILTKAKIFYSQNVTQEE